MTLRELRLKLEISQGVVAERMGTTQSYVSHLERTIDRAYLSTLQRYVEALGGRLELTAVFREGPPKRVRIALPAPEKPPE